MRDTPAFVVVELWHEAFELVDAEWLATLMHDDVGLIGLEEPVTGKQAVVERLGAYGFEPLKLWQRESTVVASQVQTTYDVETGRQLTAPRKVGAVFRVTSGRVAAIEILETDEAAKKRASVNNRTHRQEQSGGLWSAWHAWRRDRPKPFHAEFALFSDASFDGEIEMGPLAILPGLGDEALIVRFEGRPPFPWTRQKPQTHVSAWHGGDLGDEAAALLALICGVRLQSGGDREHARRPYLPAPQYDAAPMLPGLARDILLDDAAAVLETYPDLDDRTARSLLRAARQYAQGLWVADGDPNLSGLRLVGALEAAAELIPDSDASDFELLSQGFSEMAEVLEDADEDVRDRAAALLRKQTMVMWKLRTFMAAHWPQPPTMRPHAGARVDWSALEQHLNKIYKHRSAALHSGTPFPAFMCFPPASAGPGEPPAETPTDRGGWSGVAGWSAEDMPMHLHVFEHIVRQALVHWWRTQL